jgi:ribosomal protein S18 acetylase RimI-like enzyme
MIEIRHAESDEDMIEIGELFLEYAGALGFDLSFQKFEQELADLPGDYSPPGGCLLAAIEGPQFAGCVGLRKFDEGICEMKRLYVKPSFRGRRIGRSLAISVIEEAKKMGYSNMRLDTVPAMKQAIPLYYSLGFKPISPYRENPIDGALFLELALQQNR